MSDHRYTAIFGGAVLTAGLATFAVYRILGAAATPRHEPVRAVVVALRDVPAGVPVPSDALGLASWPVRVAPAESFSVPDSVVGRVTRAPLMPGEPVLVNRLAVRGAAPGLEGAIDPARRAMAVRVNEAASVSGLVRANSRVDVLMASRADGTAQPVGRVLMTDVRVLGVGSVRPPEPQGGAAEPTPSNMTASIVTLEVTPAQAEELAAAEGQGAIQVVLRGYGSVGNAPAPVSNVIDVVEAPRGMGSRGGIPGSTSGNSSAPVHTVRRNPRDVASTSLQHAVDTTAGTTPRVEAPVIQVFRGSTLTTLRLDASGTSVASGGRGGAGAGAPGGAGSGTGGNSGAGHPLNTADAHSVSHSGLAAQGPR